MSCNCCCTNTLNFCKTSVCEGEIDFDVIAVVDGTHKLVTDFLGVQVVIEAEIDAGDKIIFPVDDLNESYEYTGQIFDPLGNKVVIRKDDIEYDCIKFKTVMSVAV